MATEKLGSDKIALVAITRNAAALAFKIKKLLGVECCIYLPEYLRDSSNSEKEPVEFFPKVSMVMKGLWESCRLIVCIMATGIVVRSIAPLLVSKTQDPAVVVVDEKGEFVISLLSGHVGGANDWAHRIAFLIGARPVITTASDVRKKIALDLLAREKGLVVHDNQKLPTIMRCLLNEEPLWVFDPDCWIVRELKTHYPASVSILYKDDLIGGKDNRSLGIWVSEEISFPQLNCIRLHPRNLIVGLGCNKNTSAEEILRLVEDTFKVKNLYLGSISSIATVDIKREEAGILEAANILQVPVFFVEKEKLGEITVPNPSSVVERHIGVCGVCEAAPIAINRKAQLVVTKVKSGNVTLAVAKVPSPS